MRLQITIVFFQLICTGSTCMQSFWYKIQCWQTESLYFYCRNNPSRWQCYWTHLWAADTCLSKWDYSLYLSHQQWNHYLVSASERSWNWFLSSHVWRSHRSHKDFTATLTLVHNGRTSVLDVPALESLLGTDLEVFCEDVLDGNKQKKKNKPDHFYTCWWVSE